VGFHNKREHVKGRIKQIGLRHDTKGPGRKSTPRKGRERENCISRKTKNLIAHGKEAESKREGGEKCAGKITKEGQKKRKKKKGNLRRKKTTRKKNKKESGGL